MKKYFISLAIFSLILFSFFSISFANNLTNDVKNTAGNVGNALANTSNDAKGAIKKAEDTVENGVKDVKNTVSNTSRTVTNAAKNTATDMSGALANSNNTYTATRTSATDSGFLGMSSTSWTWLILAIVGIAIVALVWYYGAQYEHTNYDEMD